MIELGGAFCAGVVVRNIFYILFQKDYLKCIGCKERVNVHGSICGTCFEEMKD